MSEYGKEDMNASVFSETQNLYRNNSNEISTAAHGLSRNPVTKLSPQRMGEVALTTRIAESGKISRLFLPETDHAGHGSCN